jgi:hypothetical protein
MMEFTQAANHKNWSTARKNRARDMAATVGKLDTEAVGNRILAATGVVGFLALIVGATELVEAINL